jgi:hypothetical protein
MIITPPTPITRSPLRTRSVFLAGTIDNGSSTDWQQELARELDNHNITVYNPRRADWDKTWDITYENPQFYQQVNWELNALEKANVIVMYFAPGSVSPISLLELGLFATSSKLMVCCPKEFWRRGNVEAVCDRYSIPFYEDLNDLKEDLLISLDITGLEKIKKML